MNGVRNEGLNERIAVVPYDHQWIRDAEKTADKLRAALGHLAIDVQHIGSTAVTGLAAKPIVDLAAGVPGGSALRAKGLLACKVAESGAD